MARYMVSNFEHDVAQPGSDAWYTQNYILGGVATTPSATDFATWWSEYHKKIHEYVKDCNVFMPELLNMEKEILLKMNTRKYVREELDNDLTDIKDKIRNWMKDNERVTSALDFLHRAVHLKDQDHDQFSDEIEVYKRANKVYQIIKWNLDELKRLDQISSQKDKANLVKKYMNLLIEALEPLIPGQSSGRSWN